MREVDQLSDESEARAEGWLETAFCLDRMHSYIELPICPADRVARFTSDTVHTYSKWGVPVEMSIPAYGADPQCKFGGPDRIAVHYNIPSAERKFVFEHRSQTSCPDHGYGGATRIGGANLHPVCAWGVLQDLQAVYEDPAMRVSMSVAPAKGMREGVMDFVGPSLLPTATRSLWKMRKVHRELSAAEDRRAAAQEAFRDKYDRGDAEGNARRWEALGTAREAVLAAETELERFEREEDIRTVAAKRVDWARVLDCKNAHGTAEFLRPVCRGAVCWNQVRDFYHLYCTYWRADAAAVRPGCSVEEEDCCARVAQEHAAFRGMGSVMAQTPEQKRWQVERFARLTLAILQRADPHEFAILDPEISDVLAKEAADLKKNWKPSFFTQAVAPGWTDALQATFTSLQARVEQGREMMFEERERLVQLMDIVGTELHRLPPLADHD